MVNQLQPRTVTPSPSLLTIGYEGLSIEAFIDRLKEVRVSLVVDVRELPLSRKKGFSKSSFRERLAAERIGYQHLPALGCPRPVRDRYKSDGDWQAYTRAFLAYLATQRVEVFNLAETARESRACLVCYEADHAVCHRTYVARAAHAAGAPRVQHLSARTVVSDVSASLAA